MTGVLRCAAASLVAAAAALAPLVAHADGSPVSRSGELWFHTGAFRVEGTWGRMTRREGRVTAVVRARMLAPGEPVILSWAVFNRPRACHDDGKPLAMCQPGDLANPAVMGDFIQVPTSYAAGPRGAVTIRASLLTRGAGGPTGLTVTGLRAPLHAEVQLLIGQVAADGVLHTQEFAVFDPGGEGGGAGED
ncbi:MAG: hypothetical protein ACREPI_08155 [Candidatus Dormibacterales bacterium]